MNINSNDRNIVNRNKIQEIVNQIDPRHTLDPEVEEVLLEIADEFMDSVTGFACALAKHRNSESLEVRDLQLHLQKNWGMKIPGYMLDEEPVNTEASGGTGAGAAAGNGSVSASSILARRSQMTDLHKQRINLVKRSEYAFQKKAKKKQDDTTATGTTSQNV